MDVLASMNVLASVNVLAFSMALHACVAVPAHR